jgi:RHS repeat-associated protein
MPMKKRFYHVEGQMVAYDSGGVTKDFLTDHLGSIIAEVDQDENVTYQARYSAYGPPTSSTGTGCGFGWVGTHGYRETGLPHMSHYVRARHYSQVTGNWSTVDPLWPGESAYGYVGGRSTTGIDPTGRQSRLGVDPWNDYQESWRRWWERMVPPPPPPPSKGCMDYNFSYDFWWGFKYGNCCGGAKQCPPDKPKEIPPGVGKPSKGGKPKIDCLDQACGQHDKDIPDPENFGKPGPHFKLCFAVLKCDCASMYKFGTLDHKHCVEAKKDLIRFGCTMGGIMYGRP